MLDKCLCQHSLESTVTPRYFTSSDFGISVPCMASVCWGCEIFLLNVICWHLAGWNSMSQLASHSSKFFRSSCRSLLTDNHLERKVDRPQEGYTCLPMTHSSLAKLKFKELVDWLFHSSQWLSLLPNITHFHSYLKHRGPPTSQALGVFQWPTDT